MELDRPGLESSIVYDVVRIVYFLTLLLFSPSFCNNQLNIFFGFPIICITCKHQQSRDYERLRQDVYDDIPIFFMLFIFYCMHLFDNCYYNSVFVVSMIIYVIVSIFYMTYMYNNCGRRRPIVELPDVVPPPLINSNPDIILNTYNNEERNTLLEFIPKYKINRLNENIIDYDCPICLEPQTDLDKSVKFICKHYYHKKCIISWIRSGNHTTCPVCKENLKLSNVNNI